MPGYLTLNKTITYMCHFYRTALASHASMRCYSLAMMAMVMGMTMALAATFACANDLKDLYELALTRDASLQAAGFQRDAAIEVKPPALRALLPPVSGAA